MSEHLSLTVPPPEEDVAFDLKGVARGAKLILPIALGVATYGLVFGVLAQQAKLSILEVLLMSTLVFAGSAQLIVLSLWIYPLPSGSSYRAKLIAEYISPRKRLGTFSNSCVSLKLFCCASPSQVV